MCVEWGSTKTLSSSRGSTKTSSSSKGSLIEFERSRVIELREGGFSFHDIAERLDWKASIVHDCWEQWSRNGTTPRRLGSAHPHRTTEREDCCTLRTAVKHRTASAAEIRAAVASIPLTPRHCRLRGQWCQARAHWRTEWRSVVFSDESRSAALMPVMAVCWSEGGQRNAYNQNVCGLDTVDLHLKSLYGEQFPMTAGAHRGYPKHNECKFGLQSDN
ncbi:transposable element Tc1 transposase [Trichonephila clavipes]|nr:transposable element Tc1 transposase [Trichonephila clavipes]